MLRLFVAGLFCLVGAQASAQVLDERYEEIGEIRVIVAGDGYDLIVVYDKAKRFSYARERKSGAQRKYSVLGQSVQYDGKPGAPSLQIDFTETDGEVVIEKLEIQDEHGFREPLMMAAGEGVFTKFEVSKNNRVSGDFAATLRRFNNADVRNPVALEDAPPVKVTGRLKFTLKQ